MGILQDSDQLLLSQCYLVCSLCHLLHWGHPPQHVADVHHGNNLCLGAQQRMVGCHVNLLAFCQWDVLDDGTGGLGNHLPWYDGAVVLSHTHDNLGGGWREEQGENKFTRE